MQRGEPHGQHPTFPNAEGRAAAGRQCAQSGTSAGLCHERASSTGAARRDRLPEPDLLCERGVAARHRARIGADGGPDLRGPDRAVRPPSRPHEGHARAAGRNAGGARCVAAGPGLRPRDRQRQDAAQLRADPAQRCSGSEVAGFAAEEAGAGLAADRERKATAERVGGQYAVAGRRGEDGSPEAFRSLACCVVRVVDRQGR